MTDNKNLSIESNSYASTLYWINHIVGVSGCIENECVRDRVEVVIPEGDLFFFRKLTGEKEKTMEIVLLSLFKMLLKRFFIDTSRGKFRSSGINNAILFDVDFDFNIDLKENLVKEKTGFLERTHHRDYDTSRINLDQYADCTFSFNTMPCLSVFDKLELNVLYKDEDLQISFLYLTEAIGKDLALNFLNYYCYAIAYLKELVENIKPNYFFLLSADFQLIEKVNLTDHYVPEDQNLVGLFEKQVITTPENIAVKCDGYQLTYRELNKLCNQFCYFLTREYGVKKGDIVALDLSRSEQMIVSIFGALKSGAAYLPIDHHLPPSRKEVIIKDSGAKAVIDGNILTRFNGIVSEFPSQNPINNITSKDLAYVIYTSGSTGNPKGVMIEHQGIVNRLCWMQSAYPLGDKDVLIQKTNYSFDVSVWEIFWWSLFGASLYIPAIGVEKDPELLVNEIKKGGVSVIHFVPSMFAVFLDYLKRNEHEKIKLNALKQVFTSGEALPAHLKETFYLLWPDKELMNLYGPTEASIDVTFFDCRTKLSTNQAIPIGTPIWNTRIRILNQEFQPVPVGVTGNLYIEGIGLARGYLNRTDLTDERFVHSPLTHERMYDSGDLARWLPDGNIEFLGRRDFQVKIRGHRIELGEIENFLLSFENKIIQSVVEAKDIDGDKVLVAYYVSKTKNEEIDKSDLKHFLQQKLPEYMIPAFFIELESIPLTSSGKIDRKALPATSGEDAIKRVYTAPGTETEQKLVEIWQTVLGVDKIGITDNFFDLGGHSLKVGQVINGIFQQLSLSIGFKDFFSNPTIKGISNLLKKNHYSPIPRAVKQESYPLTPSQQRLWVLSHLEGGSQAYNMPAVVALNGSISIVKLEAAFGHLIKKYEILRTCFKDDDESQSIRQFIQSEDCFVFKIEEVNFTGKADEEIELFLQKTNNIAFDLEKAPLIRAILIKRADNKYIFFLSMHHLIGDGWSTEILISEVVQAYNKLLHEGKIDTKELRIQYKDYAVWLEQMMQGERYQVSENYWLKQFMGDIPVLDLPRFESRQLVQTYCGDKIEHVFSDGFLRKVKGFADKHGATLFMALLSGINAVFYRYTDQEDIILGTPVAGREHPDLEGQIGLFLNTLAIRTVLGKEETFAGLLKKVKSTLFEAYEHQFYPFDHLLAKLEQQRDKSRSALFDVLVVLQNQRQLNFDHTLTDLGGVIVEESSFNRGTSQFDMSFVFVERGEELGLSIEYNTDIYDRILIKQIFEHFEHLVNAAIDHENASLTHIDLLTERERHQILHVFNDTEIEYPKGKNIIDLFEEQVEKTPGHIAVVFENIELSYAALNEQANQLGNYLRQNYNIKSDDLVAIKLERSEQMIIAVLGVLKSGAAYVPIDMNHPQERIDFILKDTQAKVIIDKSLLGVLQSKCKEGPEGNLLKVNTPADLAYVIYTSGSTGNPKGVLNTHEGLYNRLLWMKEYLRVTDEEVFLQKTPYTFDVSVWELLLPFITGSKLVIAEPEKHKDPLYLEEVIEAFGVTIIHFVPSMLGAFLLDINTGKCATLQHIVCSGEELQSTLVESCREKFKDVRVHNLYGPTEASIDVTAIDLTGIDVLTDGVSIGCPVANTGIYIVNSQYQLQPVGIAGELLISGVQVARGYLHLQELTSLRFIPDPFRPGNRAYCTGDIARWLPDGRIQYLGRRDGQVKIRGNRIELGEVENALSLFAGVQQAVVAVKEINGDKVLVAYMSGQSAIDNQVLRKYLRNILPDYMLPGYYVELESIPLTSSGKADRKKLPLPDESNSLSGKSDYIAPRNSIEQQLVQLWQEILGKASVGVTDSFFELGGHSLKATRLVSQIYKVFEVRVALKDIFNYPVLEEQAILLARSKKTLFASIPAVAKQSFYPLSSSQRRSWVLSQFSEGSAAYHMPGVFEFEGTLDTESLGKAFHTLIERHEILRTVFRATTDGEIRQYVLSVTELGFKIGQHDLRKTSRAVIKETIQTGLFRPFDLANGPILTGDLYQLSGNRWIFSYVMHHIISDGWSMEVLIKELLQLYHTHVEREDDSLVPLRIHYKDYAVWQQQQLNGEAFQQQKQYWLQQFSGAIPVLELPTDSVRSAIKTYHGASVEKIIAAEVSSGIIALCRSSNCTLFMGLFAAINALLYRYSGQEDIIIGSPVAGRDHADLEGQIGFYVNTLALRTRFSGMDNYLQLLLNVKQLTLDAYEYQSYPFDALIDELELQRDLSRNALFDVLVVLEHQSNTSVIEKGFNGLKVKAYEDIEQASKFDLQFNFIEDNHGLKAKITYNTDLYRNETIAQLLNHLEQLMKVMVANPEQPIASLTYLSAMEQERISAFNKVIAPAPTVTLTTAFKNQVRQTPGHIALVFGDKKVSYQELDIASDKLALYLRDIYGVKSDDLVGIQLERSEWMIISLLGILKAGAAFVPIDPAYPQERIDYIVTDSQCKIILDERELEAYGTNANKYQEEVLQDINTDADLAYVVYTSGSTGRPKGVMISHAALYNYIVTIGKDYSVDSQDRILQVSNFAFDAAVEQIMLSLLNGAVLHVVPQSLITNVAGLNDYISTHQITHLHTVPTLLQEIDYKITPSLKRVISAGESCPVSLVEKVGENITFYNKYGPTEATISATMYKCRGKQGNYNPVPIGQPLGNSKVYILSDYGQLQPMGVPGELCIAGSGLARGYLHRPELTAEKFVIHPLISGERIYHTGDIGKWGSDGNIRLLGRKDDQVKIRGHRIELGEVNQVLHNHAKVTAAVTVAILNSSGDNILVAYVVSAEALDTLDLRSWLGAKLPQYMVPAHFIQLNALPLLPNGKVNKKALPVPESQHTAYVAPRNQTEEQLVQIWKDILGKEQIGVTDNFFELGGHSLKAMQILSKIQQQFSIQLSIPQLFKYPYIENISDQINFILEQQKIKSSIDQLVQIEI